MTQRNKFSKVMFLDSDSPLKNVYLRASECKKNMIPSRNSNK